MPSTIVDPTGKPIVSEEMAKAQQERLEAIAAAFSKTSVDLELTHVELSTVVMNLYAQWLRQMTTLPMMEKGANDMLNTLLGVSQNEFQLRMAQDKIAANLRAQNLQAGPT